MVRFAEPDRAFRPRVRWWWPGGAVSRAGIERELAEIADAGFARAEIALLPMGLPTGVDSAAVRTWGTPVFTERLTDALNAARALGMRVDLTVSPGWPLASPAVAGERIDLAQRKLVRGVCAAAPGQSAHPVPDPEGEPTADDLLVAVTAAQPADADAPALLVEESVVDLTAKVADGVVHWTPPPGPWLLFAFYSRPAGQRSVAEACPHDAPVIDHFSRAAVAAAVEHIDRHVLPAALDPLLSAAGGDLFEDSLEIAADAELWTATLLAEFAGRRGYDLTPYLPVLRVDRLYRFDWATLLAGITPESPADHDFPGGRGRRVRHDYYRTLNELYIDNHVTPLTEWANRRGLRYRAQPYGNTMDHVEVGAAVQVPESEDLVNWIAAGGMTDGAVAYERAIDFHRGIASAAHMSGGDIVSMECCAVLGADYQTDVAALKRHVDVGFAGGVNQLVLHGFPYQEVPGAAWPGWAPFSNDSSPQVSDAWGPRQPGWRHLRAFSDYVARACAVLRCGRPRVDVAVYRQSYWVAGWPKVTVANLADAGYSYGFLSPSLLESADVVDGRLAPGRAGYRALVLDREEAMDLPALRRVRALAAAGLPVVVVGAPPTRARGLRDDDRAVALLSAELLSLPTVRQVDDQSQVLAALAAVGVTPDAHLTGAAGVRTVHREDQSGDYYFLFNMGATAARFTASLRGTGAARVLDLWNGTSHPVDALDFELGPAETAAVFVGAGPGPDAVASPAPARTSPVREIWSMEQTAWALTVEDWGPAGNSTRVLGERPVGDWRTTPGLVGVSGVGTYRATVHVPADLIDSVDAVWLDVGVVGGTMRVRVNGGRTAADCVAGRPLDVRPHLLAGPNIVEIEVATTLGNRLIALAASDVPGYARFAERAETPAGLLGPVRLRGVSRMDQP